MLDAASPTADCLSDDVIALLASENNRNVAGDANDHILTCGECRRRVTAVAGLMQSQNVAREITALEAPIRSNKQRWSRMHLTVTGGLLAAATATIVLLGHVRSRPGLESSQYREVAITTTSAPRIVSPVIVNRLSDSLRWTRVPQADLYRVRIWSSEGTVIWSTETRDTAAALPPAVHASTSYMWDVSARTGWDRWVSSDFVELKIGSQSAR